MALRNRTTNEVECQLIAASLTTISAVTEAARWNKQDQCEFAILSHSQS